MRQDIGRLTSQPAANFESADVPICVGSTYNQALRRGGCESPFWRPITVRTVRVSPRGTSRRKTPSGAQRDLRVWASTTSMIVRASSVQGPFEMWQELHDRFFARMPTP